MRHSRAPQGAQCLSLHCLIKSPFYRLVATVLFILISVFARCVDTATPATATAREAHLGPPSNAMSEGASAHLDHQVTPHLDDQVQARVAPCALAPRWKVNVDVRAVRASHTKRIAPLIFEAQGRIMLHSCHPLLPFLLSNPRLLTTPLLLTAFALAHLMCCGNPESNPPNPILNPNPDLRLVSLCAR